MKVQVIQPFSVNPAETYSLGDMLDVDEATAKKLIAAGRVVEGTLEPFVNFNPFAPREDAPVVETVVKSTVVADIPQHRTKKNRR